MGDIYFNVLIRVCVSTIAFQHEGFPLARERGFSDAFNERITTFVWMCRYEMLNISSEGGDVVVWRDMCMVGWEGRYMMGCGEGIGGRVILTFLFKWLTHRSFGLHLDLLLLALFGWHPSLFSFGSGNFPALVPPSRQHFIS